MKTLNILTIAMLMFFFSCKKELLNNVANNLNSDENFVTTIQQILKDSLSSTDYNSIDFGKLFKSRILKSDFFYVRIGIKNESIATDFLLLKSDSLGTINSGKIIHLDRDQTFLQKDATFKGQFTISTLNRQNRKILNTTTGKQKVPSNTNSLLVEAEAPAGTQYLPEVVVTTHTSKDDNGVDWYWYDGLYDSDAGAGGGVGYTYGSASGSSGGGGSSYHGTVDEDDIIVVEVESSDNEPIKAEEYIKCFSTISDIKATYQISILSDVPVDSDPSIIFNPNTGSPGHSFLQLTKTSGTQSVTQNIGFYPAVGWKSVTGYSVDGKLVDNAYHEYNAELTMSVDASKFQAALNKMTSLSGSDYNIETFNCTDFALGVFNSATSVPLIIPQVFIPGSTGYSATPQGLYSAIKSLSDSHNTSHGTTSVPASSAAAGDSHGSCE